MMPPTPEALARVRAAAPLLYALLCEYAQRSADITDPAPGSLTARTRALLATLEAPPRAG